MNTYVYYYKADSSCEPIGRVMAMNLYDARELIVKRKQLSYESVDKLFEIKQVLPYEKDNI
jgi:hypothetical protein